jgi:hypothetical protein
LCNIIVLNAQTQYDGKSDDVKDSFYEEVGRVFDQFPRYDMNILLGKFNAKVGRGIICKVTIGNDSPQEISNDCRVKVVNFAIVVNSTR